MRKKHIYLIAFLMLLSATVLQAQNPFNWVLPFQQSNQTAGFRWRGVKITDGLIVPALNGFPAFPVTWKGDSTRGALQYYVPDSSFYGFTGYNWFKIGGTGSGSSTVHLDTVLSKNQYFISASVGAGNGLGVDSVKWRFPTVTSGLYGDTVHNFSVPGAFTQPNLPSDSGYLPQLRQIPYKTQYDRYLIIEPSSNDIGANQAPYDTTQAGIMLRRIIDSAIAHRFTARSIVIVADPLLTASQRAFYGVVNGVGAPSLQRCIDYRTMWYNAARVKGCIWVDLQKDADFYGDSILLTANGGTGDGFHPNRFGQNRIATAIYNKLYYGYDSTGSITTLIGDTSTFGGVTLDSTNLPNYQVVFPINKKLYTSYKFLVDTVLGRFHIGYIVPPGGTNALNVNGSATFAGSVAIGVNNAASSLALDVQSTTKAFAPPRMTYVQMLAIPLPVAGANVYVSDSLAAYMYNGFSWIRLGPAGSVNELQLNGVGNFAASQNLKFLPAGKGILVDSGRFYIGDTIRYIGTSPSSGYLFLGAGNTRLQGLSNAFIQMNNNSVAVSGNLFSNTGFNATNTAVFNIASSSGTLVNYGVYRATGNFSTGTFSSSQSSMYKLFGTVGAGIVPEFIGYHDSLNMAVGTKYTSIKLNSRAVGRDYVGLHIAPVAVGGFNYAILAESGQVGIGTAAPDPSSIMDLVSSTKGLLFPRMTSANRLAIPSPAVGLIVYQTDATEGLYIYKSTGWTFII